MKTAEEILKECTGHAHGLMDHSTIQAMKLYANAKLDQAAERLKQTAGQWNADYASQKNSILSLKDKV